MIICLGIVEDDSSIRQAFIHYFSRQAGFKIAFQSSSVEELLQLLKEGYGVDVLIMDIGLPGMSGIDGIKLAKQKIPETDIIVFSVFNDNKRIFEALCAGAVGYLLKSTPFDEIKSAVEVVRSGGSPMSPQIARKVVSYFSPSSIVSSKPKLSDKEREIVVGLVDGLSYKLIADRLCVTIETVRFHIKNIYRKLHVHSKAEVITKSLKGDI